LNDLADRGVKFGTIYINPPWDPARLDPSLPRTTWLTPEELFALPVPRLAAKPSHLQVWVPPRFIKAGLELLKHWGFAYKSNFTCCYTEPEPGPSDYWPAAHDHLLLGVRGKLVFRDHTIRSWQVYERCPNGCRPEQVRRFIERASPGPRLELFGRGQVEGWTVWGNQMSRDSFTHAVTRLAA
jgi:N6-adenosine-specific RNA methylase IME4